MGVGMRGLTVFMCATPATHAPGVLGGKQQEMGCSAHMFWTYVQPRNAILAGRGARLLAELDGSGAHECLQCKNTCIHAACCTDMLG
eukprot:scaffold10876_cov22-Tisochrysis_lutea.AAC.1